MAKKNGLYLKHLKWKGADVAAEIEARATRALEEIDLRIQAGAKQELWPGHGVVTGTLRRDIQAGPVEKRGRRLIGRVGTSQITKAYSLLIHNRYLYLRRGFEKVKPQASAILNKHMKG